MWPCPGLKDTRDTVKMAEEDSVTRKSRGTFTPGQKAEAMRFAEEVGNVAKVALVSSRTTKE